MEKENYWSITLEYTVFLSVVNFNLCNGKQENLEYNPFHLKQFMNKSKQLGEYIKRYSVLPMTGTNSHIHEKVKNNL